MRKTYWPANAPRELAIDAFVAAFVTLGYKIVSAEGAESGLEKVALFADSTGRPTHAARQLPNGRWTSKLGMSEDIEHELRALEGQIYGTVAAVLARPVVRAE